MTHSIRIEQEAVMLSNTQITEYHQDGYTVCPNFLTPDEVAQFARCNRGDYQRQHTCKS